MHVSGQPVPLETVIADVLEDQFLGAIEQVLRNLEVEGLATPDFRVREYADNVAAKIAEHTGSVPVTSEVVERLARGPRL